MVNYLWSKYWDQGVQSCIIRLLAIWHTLLQKYSKIEDYSKIGDSKIRVLLYQAYPYTRWMRKVIKDKKACKLAFPWIQGLGKQPSQMSLLLLVTNERTATHEWRMTLLRVKNEKSQIPKMMRFWYIRCYIRTGWWILNY